MTTPSREQLISQINELEKQGVPKADIQTYLDSFKGKTPTPTATPQKQGSFVGDVVRGATKPLVTLATRPYQLAKAIGGATPEEQAVDLPFYGKIETSQSGKDVVKDIGRGLETVSLGLGGGAARAVGQNVVKQTVKQAIKTGAIEGLKTGATFGAGEAIEDTGELASGLKGAIVGGATGLATGGLLSGVGAGVVKAGQGVAQIAKPVIDTIGKVAGSSKDMAKNIAGGFSRIPARIQTNVEANQALTGRLKALPSDNARRAVQDGVDILDVKALYRIPKDQAKILKGLPEAVKKFADGDSQIHPEQIVGSPIAKRLKTLDTQADEIGAELGAVAKTFTGKVTAPESASAVMSQLKKVRGLSGLKVSSKGILSFKDTTLSSALSVSDRKAVQKAFTAAIRPSTGVQKHRLRQELFEILGGKKRSLKEMTETQENAFDAIRQGLSDVLETKDGRYKTLSKEFAEVSGALRDMRKFMKVNGNTDEDILEMSAGLLARRLTSNAPSQNDLRVLLRRIDKIGRGKGKTEISTEALQNLYNVLNKYYDITPKTAFQGEISAGIRKADTVLGMGINAVNKYGGINSDVRKKALEGIFSEILN